MSIRVSQYHKLYNLQLSVLMFWVIDNNKISNEQESTNISVVLSSGLIADISAFSADFIMSEDT